MAIIVILAFGSNKTEMAGSGCFVVNALPPKGREADSAMNVVLQKCHKTLGL